MSDKFDYNASTVTSYFVLNSQHNIHFSALRQFVYSRCLKWEREWVGMGMITLEWEGNGNKKVIPAHL